MKGKFEAVLFWETIKVLHTFGKLTKVVKSLHNNFPQKGIINKVYSGISSFNLGKEFGKKFGFD